MNRRYFSFAIKAAFLGFFLHALFACQTAVAWDLSATTSRRSSCDIAQELLSEVESLRGLTARRPIRCIELDDAGYVAYANRLIERTNSRAELEQEEGVYKAIGLLDQEYPYTTCTLFGSGDSSVVLYDYLASTLVLRQSSVNHPEFIAHELIHGLQDQNFDLKNLHHRYDDTDDSLALAALLEGDALLIERSFMKAAVPQSSSEPAQGSGAGFTSSCEPDNTLMNIILFPYDWGRRFVAELYKEGGNERIDRALSDPPRTTRLITLPLEYLNLDKNRGAQKSVRRNAKPRQSASFHQTLGQFVQAEFFKRYATRTESLLAAKGWLADDLVARTRSDGSLEIVWRLEVESAKDIQEQLAAWRAYSLKRYHTVIAPTAPGWLIDQGRVSFSLASSHQIIHATWRIRLE